MKSTRQVNRLYHLWVDRESGGLTGPQFQIGKLMKITFFDGGSTMAFENGEQVPVAQKSWLLLFCEYLEKQGIDPIKQEFVLPDGRQARIIKTEDGLNWWVLQLGLVINR